jgi:hypothetical protein
MWFILEINKTNMMLPDDYITYETYDSPQNYSNWSSGKESS